MSRDFPVCSAGIRAALDYLGAELGGSGAELRIAHRLSVILDELVANMIRHDPTLGPNEAFRVALTRERDAVRMALSDPGTAFDPLAFAHVDKPEIGGHGINVIKSLSRDISYRREDGRNIVEVLVDAKELEV